MSVKEGATLVNDHDSSMINFYTKLCETVMKGFTADGMS